MPFKTQFLLAKCCMWLGILLPSVFSSEFSEEIYRCQYATVPPSIDGEGNEKVWESAATLSNFRMAWLGAEGEQQRSATRAKILWDRDYIYFWAELEDSDLQSLVKERDGKTWDDDVFEVFVKPSVTHSGYYEFHVTPGNVQMDLFIPQRGPNAYSLYRSADSFDFKSAVRLDGTLENRSDIDRGWEVEFAVAWKDFQPTGGRPEPGERWTFSLCRYDYSSGQNEPHLTSIAPLKRKSFHDFEHFVPIEFIAPAAPPHQSGYGFDIRHPVVSSKVRGRPEPPLPFTAVSRFPNLKMDYPIAIRNEPNSDRVLLITQAEPYGPSKIGYFLRSRNDDAPRELLAVQDRVVHYDLVFDPNYPSEPYLFVGSNGPYEGDSLVSRVTRYTVRSTPDHSLELSEPLAVIQWRSNGHNGAAVTFGLDGMLYVTSGDGTTDSDTDLRGQDLTELTAKVLRIDVSNLVRAEGYKVPPDNPFVDRPATRPETWAYGLRNPWRITTDRKSGRIWVGQNGQDLWEQVYLLERGANYGWSVMEGNAPFYSNRVKGPDPISPPAADHHHSEARSLTGGIVYQGEQPTLVPLKGAYVYGDYSTGKIWGLWHDGQQITQRTEIADTASALTAFEESPEGEIWLLDHLGKNILKLIPNTTKDDSEMFPRKLSDSGLFADVKNHKLVAGAIPYDVQSPLWSDGAHKERWFVIPTDGTGDTRIEFQNEMGWTFPNGSVLIKSFALDIRKDDRSERRWIETRFMVRQQNEWAGYSYRWNDEGTDATLVDSEGVDFVYEVRDTAEASGFRNQTWHYPSRAECMVCHSRAANYTLGLQTAQMNKTFVYDGVEENQLTLLERLGFFKVHRPSPGQKANTDSSLPQRSFVNASTFLPNLPRDLPSLVNPYDATADIDQRARAYLHANCASCHQPAGGGNASIDLRYQVAMEKCGLIDQSPRHMNFDIPDAKLIVSGKPDASILMQRVSTRDNGKMPQLATNVVDRAAVEMLREWIISLSSQKNEGGN
jgi:uncharacterized repeat protein (TIGR03806 family)